MAKNKGKYMKVKLSENRQFVNLGKQPVPGSESVRKNLWFSKKKYARQGDGSYPVERVVVRTPKVEKYVDLKLLEVVKEDASLPKAKAKGSSKESTTSSVE